MYTPTLDATTVGRVIALFPKQQETEAWRQEQMNSPKKSPSYPIITVRCGYWQGTAGEERLLSWLWQGNTSSSGTG